MMNLLKNNRREKTFLLSIFLMLFLFFKKSFVLADVTSTPFYLTEPVEILYFDTLSTAIIWFLGIYLFLFIIKLLWKQ